MSGPAVLPELVRFDLNDDGSVTLLLTHPNCKIGILSFGVGNTNRPYRLAQLGATLPVEGEDESVDFRLVDAEGASLILKARTENALDIFNQIHSHMNKVDSKPEADASSQSDKAREIATAPSPDNPSPTDPLRTENEPIDKA